MRRWLPAILLPAFALTATACADDPAAGTPGVTEDYVPDAPVPYDARYLDGSFEDNNGFGWDTCHTHTPGTIRQIDGGGSEGSAYVTFESGECACTPTSPSASQIYNWFSGTPGATGEMGLYFEAKDEAGPEPTGVLRFYGTDHLCDQERLLAEIELARLQLSSGWSTRCVTVTGPGAHYAIGTSISGASYKIGIDALRLGPPCHAP